MTGTSRVVIAMAVIGAMLVSAGPAMAGLATKVAVSATSTAKVKRHSSGGAQFSGKMRFTRVKPILSGKVNKVMKGKARSACRRLYGGGEQRGYEPWVFWKQRPAALTLNAWASVKFEKDGSWITGGLHPKDSHEPYKGQKVDVIGGFYDAQYHNNRRSYMDKTFRYKGKEREAYCEGFDVVFKP